jgi:hypothetical protein
MKKYLALVSFAVLVIANCSGEDAVPLFSDVSGWLRQSDSLTAGINGVILTVGDIDPDDIARMRIRKVTTQEHDTLGGYWEMDSVCYGTTLQQGTGYVRITLDTLDNPTRPYRVWLPNVFGPADTVILYMEEEEDTLR